MSVDRIREGTAQRIGRNITPDEISSQYDALAGFFLKHKKKEGNPSNWEIPTLLEELFADGSEVSGNFLDLGTGTGLLIHEMLSFLERERPGVRFSHIIGLDVSAGMLVQAKENTTVNSTNITYIHAPMERIPLEDNSINMIGSNNVLDYASDEELEDTLAEIARIMTKGATFVASIRHPARNLAYLLAAEGDVQTDLRDLNFADPYLYAKLEPDYREGWYDESWPGLSGGAVSRYYRHMKRWFEIIEKSGFAVCSINVPMPPKELQNSDPELWQRYQERPGALIWNLRKDDSIL
jgi:SAM-dependent methyltransferase